MKMFDLDGFVIILQRGLRGIFGVLFLVFFPKDVWPEKSEANNSNVLTAFVQSNWFSFVGLFEHRLPH